MIFTIPSLFFPVGRPDSFERPDDLPALNKIVDKPLISLYNIMI